MNNSLVVSKLEHKQALISRGKVHGGGGVYLVLCILTNIDLELENRGLKLACLKLIRFWGNNF